MTDAKTLLAPLQPRLMQVVRFMSSHTPPQAAALKEAFELSVSRPGKLLRPAVSLLVSDALEGSSQQPTPRYEEGDHPALIRLAALGEMIHLATLLHDDVLDDADSRRGQPTIRFTHGNQVAVLAGDWLLAKASQTMAWLGHLEVIRIYSDVLAYLCDGELMQNAASFNRSASTWEAYWAKTQGKTGSLFAATLEATAAYHGLGEVAMADLHQAGLAFGHAFQLMDDLLDYTADAATLGKPVLDDLRNGLLNAPMLFAIEANPALGEAVDALFARLRAGETAEGEGIEATCQALKTDLLATDALTQTTTLAASHTEAAIALLQAHLPAEAPALHTLIALLRYNVHRSN